MKRLGLIVLVGLCCSFARGGEDYHVFTDASGRAINASILKYDAIKDVIFVELENGRKGNIPVSQLSESDRRYVKAWVQVKDFMNERQVIISAKRKKKDNDAESRKGRVQNRDVENMGYEIRLENKSEILFENIKVEYCIFYEQEVRQQGGGDAKQGVYCDSTTISKMLPKSKAIVESGSVKVYKEELSSEYHWVNGTDNVQRGEVHGIWIRASIEMEGGEKVVRDFCLPDSLSNSRRWTTSSVNVGMN